MELLSNIVKNPLSPLFEKSTTKTKTKTKTRKRKRSKSKSNSKSKRHAKAQTKTRPLIAKSRKLHATRSSTHRTIGDFMKRTEEARHYHFLKNICSDAGLCIAFGLENIKIKDFFNNFTSFDYVVSPIRSIGSPSENGFVKEINYAHHNYRANSILKSSTDEMSDNLVYEYMVGMQVNEWKTYFPCFIETYGLYKYNDEEQYEYIRDTRLIRDIDTLKNSLDLITTSEDKDPLYDYADMCNNSKYYAVLIEYIKNAKDMEDVMDDLNSYDTNAILAQVYFPLGRLTNDFVHYDLHLNNVMLYEPAPGKYVEYYYYFENGEIIRFKSKYVAKIIDYGRSYIKDSPQIYQQICDTEDCEPRCGWGYGFNWMTEEAGAEEYYISSALLNPSHDLRFFHEVYPDFDMVKYGVGIDNEEEQMYGTEPNFESGLPDTINNVSDASTYLRKYMKNSKRVEYFAGSAFPENKKFGELHIYMNMKTPLRFIKTL